MGRGGGHMRRASVAGHKKGVRRRRTDIKVVCCLTYLHDLLRYSCETSIFAAVHENAAILCKRMDEHDAKLEETAYICHLKHCNDGERGRYTFKFCL